MDIGQIYTSVRQYNA